MRKAHVNGVDLSYAVHGQGEALVLIPGLGADHTAWFRQIPVLKRFFRVIVYDPRSLGKSERPQEPFDIKTMVDDVIALLGWLKVEKAHFLGHSMGGIVAREIAIHYPQRVLKLILASSPYGRDDISEISPHLRDVLGLKPGSTEIDFARLNARRTLNTLIGLSFNTKFYRRLMQFLAALFVTQRMLIGLTDQLHAVSHTMAVDTLNLIKVPVLIITGDQDRIVEPYCSKLLSEMIPHAKLLMMPGASHALNIEMPDLFNHVVMNFLKDHG